MQGLPFNSTEFLGKYASEIKAIEKRIFLNHRDDIIKYLELVRDSVYMSAVGFHQNRPSRMHLDAREIEQMASDILNSMEAELKEAVTEKYVLTQRPKDEKPYAPKTKSVCDRLKDWLP